MIDFFTKKITLKNAAEMCMSVGGKLATQTDKEDNMTGPCIVGAMVGTHLLGKPTSWILAHDFWHTLTKEQVTLKHWQQRAVSHSLHDTIPSSHTSTL
jgi:hypothetical protein